MTRTKLGTAVVLAMLALSGCANLAPDFMRPAAPILDVERSNARMVDIEIRQVVDIL